jgi:hypothetical protein
MTVKSFSFSFAREVFAQKSDRVSKITTAH